MSSLEPPLAHLRRATRATAQAQRGAATTTTSCTQARLVGVPARPVRGPAGATRLRAGERMWPASSWRARASDSAAATGAPARHRKRATCGQWRERRSSIEDRAARVATTGASLMSAARLGRLGRFGRRAPSAEQQAPSSNERMRRTNATSCELMQPTAQPATRFEGLTSGPLRRHCNTARVHDQRATWPPAR